MQDLFFFLIVASELFISACGIYFSDQQSTLGPLRWEHGVLTTGPPGKSQPVGFLIHPLKYIYSTMKGHWGGFQFLAITTDAAICILGHISLGVGVKVSPGYTGRDGV